MPAARRPYRSHKTPACDRCRRFKRRCSGGEAGDPCVLCKLQNVPCLPSWGGTRNSRNQAVADPDAGKAPDQRQRFARSPQTAVKPTQGQGQGSLTPPYSTPAKHHIVDPESNPHDAIDIGDSSAESSIVVSPMLTEDIQTLERYFSAGGTGMEHPRTTDGSGNSLVYMKVPRRREGLAIAKHPGKSQKEIIWQLMRPYANELIRLYFLKLHTAFPILDQKSFLGIFEQGHEKISPALLCEFFAVTLIVWDHSEELKRHLKPDYKFVWNLAVEALQQDFLAPGLSTICSVLLDMTGRPVAGVLGNTINNGRAVALARSLGLNHNPTHWKRPPSEKALRIRLWWAILIHDYWSSFAHGVPPNITNRQFDVPVPVLADFVHEDETEEVMKSSECFIHLCTLSLILGEILPLVYDLKLNMSDIWRQVRRLESDLDDWEQRISLPLNGPNEKYPTSVSGLSSLCLCYLSTRLLLCRITFRAASRSEDMDRADSMRYHMSKLRRSAQAISDYMCSMTRAQFHEFWIAYAAELLTFAFFILLRCAVESSEEVVTQSCKFSISELWMKLQDAAENEGWDLAGMCISHCAEPMSKIMKMFSSQRIDFRLPPESIQDINGLPKGPDNPIMYDSETATLDNLVPNLLPFSSLDLWFENPSGSSWGELDMGLTSMNMPFIDHEIGMEQLNN